MAKTLSSEVSKPKKRLCYFYEPKKIPVVDKEGNVIGYDCPPVQCRPLAETDSLRVKSFPNELGCSANPENVEGFQATLEILNAHRNTRTSGLSAIGSDDCGMMAAVDHYIRVSQPKTE